MIIGPTIDQSLALRSDGTVTNWGASFASIPADLTNATAIACGTNFCLALRTNGTVVAWGNNSSGQTNVSASATNVVAIAAGGDHALALREDGHVIAWGNNSSGQTNVPSDLTNAMAVAAGWAHSVALRNDGTVVVWGDNAQGQTNIFTNLPPVKLLAAGANHTLAAIYSPLVQYPVDVKKDLLLIYNTNSSVSSNVCFYYLARRPMVSGANLLGVGCGTATNQTIDDVEFTNQLGAPFLSWIAANPTRRPQYVILFPDIPTAVWSWPNVGCRLRELAAGFPPFVHYINMGLIVDMGNTNACMAYVDKLAYFGSNYCPGKLFISPSDNGYANTNYCVDGLGAYGPSDGRMTTNSLLLAGVSLFAIKYVDGDQQDVLSNHILQAANVAGYFSFAGHSSLSNTFAIDGRVQFQGQSGWFAMTTYESYNGVRNYLAPNYLSTYVEWYSSNAFGGTNYENTPVVAVANTQECNCAPDPAALLALWAGGKSAAICSWQAGWRQQISGSTLVVGDPFVKR